MFMFERPVGTNARPQGRHLLLAWPPGIFCCAKPPGLGTHFGAKALGCPGGMVTGQIDTCITLYRATKVIIKIISEHRTDVPSLLRLEDINEENTQILNLLYNHLGWILSDLPDSCLMLTHSCV